MSIFKNETVYLVTDRIEAEENYGFGMTIVLIGVFHSLREAQKAVKNRIENLRLYIENHYKAEIEDWELYFEKHDRSDFDVENFEEMVEETKERIRAGYWFSDRNQSNEGQPLSCNDTGSLISQSQYAFGRNRDIRNGCIEIRKLKIGKEFSPEAVVLGAGGYFE